MRVDLSKEEIYTLLNALGSSPNPVKKKLMDLLADIFKTEYDGKMRRERPHLWRNRLDGKLYYLEEDRSGNMRSIRYYGTAPHYYGGERRKLNSSSWKRSDFEKVAKV